MLIELHEHDLKIHCRAGSLEIEVLSCISESPIHCRAGSLEIRTSLYDGC